MTNGNVDFGVMELSDHDSEGVCMMLARRACKVIKRVSHYRAFSEGPVISWAPADKKNKS